MRHPSGSSYLSTMARFAAVLWSEKMAPKGCLAIHKQADVDLATPVSFLMVWMIENAASNARTRAWSSAARTASSPDALFRQKLFDACATVSQLV